MNYLWTIFQQTLARDGGFCLVVYRQTKCTVTSDKIFEKFLESPYNQRKDWIPPYEVVRHGLRSDLLATRGRTIWTLTKICVFSAWEFLAPPYSYWVGWFLFMCGEKLWSCAEPHYTFQPLTQEYPFKRKTRPWMRISWMERIIGANIVVRTVITTPLLHTTTVNAKRWRPKRQNFMLHVAPPAWAPVGSLPKATDFEKIQKIDARSFHKSALLFSVLKYLPQPCKIWCEPDGSFVRKAWPNFCVMTNFLHLSWFEDFRFASVDKKE